MSIVFHVAGASVDQPEQLGAERGQPRGVGVGGGRLDRPYRDRGEPAGASELPDEAQRIVEAMRTSRARPPARSGRVRVWDSCGILPEEGEVPGRRCPTPARHPSNATPSGHDDNPGQGNANGHDKNEDKGKGNSQGAAPVPGVTPAASSHGADVDDEVNDS